MTSRNIIELVIVLITIAILIPLFLFKRKKTKDLDGFEMIEGGIKPEEDSDETYIV